MKRKIATNLCIKVIPLTNVVKLVGSDLALALLENMATRATLYDVPGFKELKTEEFVVPIKFTGCTLKVSGNSNRAMLHNQW